MKKINIVLTSVMLIGLANTANAGPCNPTVAAKIATAYDKAVQTDKDNTNPTLEIFRNTSAQADDTKTVDLGNGVSMKIPDMGCFSKVWPTISISGKLPSISDILSGVADKVVKAACNEVEKATNEVYGQINEKIKISPKLPGIGTIGTASAGIKVGTSTSTSVTTTTSVGSETSKTTTTSSGIVDQLSSLIGM